MTMRRLEGVQRFWGTSVLAEEAIERLEELVDPCSVCSGVGSVVTGGAGVNEL